MIEDKLYNIDWEQYLQPKRQRQSGTQASIGLDSRNQFESDFGRVVFCPAIRRMHDKTQVIPLTSGDTILTRLTALNAGDERCRVACTLLYKERDGFSDLKVQSVAVQSCFTNNRSQQ